MTIRLSSRFISFLAVGLLAACGVWLVLHATPEGLGLSDDSIGYVAGARSILAGQGYREAWLASNGPVTHFPPGYPGVLAFLGLFGLDPLRGARFLSSLLFGFNIVLMGILGWRMTRKLGAGVALAALYLVSSALLQVHADALSEPLFMFLALVSFWMFDLYFERDSHSLWLVACGFVVGAAYLTRYAALALVLTFVGALIVLHGTWRKRLIGSGIFVASALPWVVGWAIHNALVAGTATNRVLVWHPIGMSDLDMAVRTFAEFLMPVESWRQALFQLPGLFAVLGILVVVAVLARVTAAVIARQGRPTTSAGEVVTFTNALYVLCYLLAILAAMFLFDASTKFRLRILAPVYPSLLILLGSAGMWLWSQRRALALALAVAVFGVSVVGQIQTEAVLSRGGQGYASFRWYDSKAIAHLKSLPESTMIFTNEPGAVYLYTGRGAYVLPDHVDPVTAEARPGFDRGVSELQSEVNAGSAVLALFSSGDTSADDWAILSRGLYLAFKGDGAEIYAAAR
jgi:4-amino-4-deoxy-L-arabinose transferase-like glycosyltransferase